MKDGPILSIRDPRSVNCERRREEKVSG